MLTFLKWLIVLPFRIIWFIITTVSSLLAQIVVLPWRLYKYLFGGLDMDAYRKADSESQGVQFERVCAAVLKNRGFKNVSITAGSGDQGTDILCTKGGLKYAVQCKYYQGPVGNHAVQEVYAGGQYYDCDVCAVMTNSTFTKAARDLAESTGVELWENSPTFAERKRNPLVFWFSLIIAIAALAYSDYRLRNPMLYIFIPFIWLFFITIYVLATSNRRR